MDAQGNKTGGRKKGTPNRATQAFWDELKELGYRGDNTEDNPAVLLWLYMSGRKRMTHVISVFENDLNGVKQKVGEQKVLEPASDETRQRLAETLIRYKYPQLKAVDVTSGGEPISAPMFGEDFRKFDGALPPAEARPAAPAARREPAAPVPSPPRRSRAARVE